MVSAGEASADDRTSLRQAARARRVALGPEARARASAVVVDRVTRLPEWERSQVVAVYEAAGSEVDVAALIDRARSTGRTVVVPEVTDRHAGLMRFVRTDDASSASTVPEPDLVIVPLLAFDRRGRRLGQGGGFYDRWLAGSSAVRVGVAFACQELPEVPVADHDQSLDVVVTEEGTLRPERRA